MDPLTQLAFSVYENKGVFALVLGSGLSRTAGIPTGWEITLDLIRRVAAAQGIEAQANWAGWYRQTQGEEPDYSKLLEELALSPNERRSILHSYIEPTEEDREDGRKVPTAAHHAISDMVGAGYIRLIVTTNFDRLLENALRERGIEPTIVASVDALSGAEPITHTACYILKLHGDYKDARILNTDDELSAYPKEYDALLDRILDEHGLIVCGWSGEWDHALKAAFLRAPNRRYPVYWAARNKLSAGAQEITDHRKARIIPITDADSFFTSLRERVETLAKTHRQNPLSIDLLINTAKRYLSNPVFRIQLEELFSQEVSRLLASLDAADLLPEGPLDQATFGNRVGKYDAATEPLARMAGVVGRWGDGSEFHLVLDLIRNLYAHAEKLSSGVTAYLNLRSYPAVLVFTAYALGLARAERWEDLHRLFAVTIARQYKEQLRAVEALFLWAWKGTDNEVWKLMEGLERKKTPLSDHLFALFSDWGKSFVGLAPDFELLFERYELLGSLSHFERNEKASVKSDLAAQTAHAYTWMPVGRVGWHESDADRLLAEIQTEPMKSALLKAAFAKGDAEFFDLFIQNFRRIADRMRW